LVFLHGVVNLFGSSPGPALHFACWLSQTQHATTRLISNCEKLPF